MTKRKRLLLVTPLLIAILSSNQLYSQQNPLVQPPTLSIGYGLYDFVSAQSIKHESFVEAFKKGSIGNLRTMNSALSLSYMEGVSKNFDMSVGMTGSFLSYPMKNKQSFPKNNHYCPTKI